MKKILISLYNGDIVDVPCSVLFVKHIEGTVCMPEEAINGKLSQDGKDVFKLNETDDEVDLYTYNTLPYPYIHVINFHQKDLPFTYSSVDMYGRGIIDFALKKSTAEKPITSVATAIHGPGAGLDASEAMERLLMAVAAELYKRSDAVHLEEFIFVERNQSVCERLRERLDFLVRQNILVYEDSKTFLLPSAVKAQLKKEHQPKLKLKEKHVFVAMPFDRNFDDVYFYGIKKAVEKNGRVSERTDQEFFTGDIIQRIKLRIMEAELIIADISGANPNVFYEIGLAHGMELMNDKLSVSSGSHPTMGKRLVFITQDEKVPFDIQTQNRIKYDRFAIYDLETKLAEAIDDILQDADKGSS